MDYIYGLYMDYIWISSENWDAIWEIRGKYIIQMSFSLGTKMIKHDQKWREVAGFFTLDYRRANGWEVGSFGTKKVYQDIPQLLVVEPKVQLAADAVLNRPMKNAGLCGTRRALRMV